MNVSRRDNMQKMPKLGNFRKQKEGESNAEYFRNAVSKTAKRNNQDDECKIQSWVSLVIQRTNRGEDVDTLVQAFNYARNQFRDSKHDLHLCSEEACKLVAWGPSRPKSGTPSGCPSLFDTIFLFF